MSSQASPPKESRKKAMRKLLFVHEEQHLDRAIRNVQEFLDLSNDWRRAILFRISSLCSFYPLVWSMKFSCQNRNTICSLLLTAMLFSVLTRSQ